MFRFIISVLVLTALSAPQTLWACACGCGIFDVGTSAMIPTHVGGMAYLEYDFMDQNRNWHNSSSASADDNSDKEIRTSFITAGAQYMFNRSWGASIDVPYADRSFKTQDDNGDDVTFHQSALGDIRLRGIYTGFSPDMTTGLTFGLKVPTGDHQQDGFDRDTVIGSGSTDLLVGGFHRGQITRNNSVSWFANTQVDVPVLITPFYRPGIEADAAAGTYYNGWNAGGLKIAPIAQVIGSVRWSDTGEDSAHADSGYKRVLLSPGLEFSTANWKLYADVAFPVFETVNGNQLVASELYKVNVSRKF